MTSKKFYAVFDTNVLVSALMSARQESPTVLLLDYVLDERIQSVLGLVQTGLRLDPTMSNEDFPDADDRVFYEVALSKDGSYVVTGNLRHFPRKPIVVSPADMIHIINNTDPE